MYGSGVKIGLAIIQQATSSTQLARKLASYVCCAGVAGSTTVGSRVLPVATGSGLAVVATAFASVLPEVKQQAGKSQTDKRSGSGVGQAGEGFGRDYLI